MDSTQIEAAPKTEGTGKLSSFKEFFISFLSLTKKHFKPLLFFVLPSLVGVAIVNLVAQANLPHIVRIIGSIVVGLPLFLFSVATSLGGFKYLKDLEETGVASKKEAYLTGLRNIVFYMLINSFAMAILFIGMIPIAMVIAFASSMALPPLIVFTVLAVSFFLLGVWTMARFALAPLFLVTEHISFFSALAKSVLITKDVVGKLMLRVLGYVVLLFVIYIPLTVLRVIELYPIYKTYGFSKMFQLFKSGTLDQFAEKGLLFFIAILIVGLVSQIVVNVMSFSFGYQILKGLKNRVGDVTEEILQKTRKRVKISFWLSLTLGVLLVLVTLSGIIFLGLKEVRNNANQIATNLNNSKVYTDTENGFQITLPASWNYVTAKKPGEPVFSAIDSATAKENIEAGLLPSAVSVEVETVKVGVTAKSVILQNLNKYKIPSTDADFQSGKDESGNEYAMFEGKDENNYVVQKVFVKGDKAFVVSGTGTPTNLQSVIQVGFVISSFKLTGLAK